MARILLLLVAAMVLPGCPTDDPEACDPAAQLCLLAQDLPEAFMSVRALADDDVWLVGSEVTPDASGPSVIAWHGAGWDRVDTSAFAGHELWWSHPTAERVTMVGTGGLILEYDRAADTLTGIDGPPPGVTFFGVWGASADDVWAVGGDVQNGVLPPQIWHRDAAGWSAWQDPFLPEGMPGELYYKVHGAAADDVWIVGNRGITLHFDGTHLSRMPTDTDLDTASLMLLTVDARGEHPIAVGGQGSPAMLHWDGSDWRDHSPEFGTGATGICRDTDTMFAVGQQGTVYRWDGAWSTDFEDTLTFADYHACDITPGGDLWAVGGQLTSRPLDEGVILFSGDSPITAP